MKSKIKNYTKDSESELLNRKSLIDLFNKNPIPNEQVLSNLGLFLDSKNLSRILLMNHLYKKIINLHGNIFEFGTRWGNNGAIFTSLRSIYEPYNRHRKIVLFDTFEGLKNINKLDGKNEMMFEKSLSTTKDYKKYLDSLMKTQESLNPLSHIKKYEIVKGDASKKIVEYLKKFPETIISLAYFDFDIYKPTKDVLKAIKPRLCKGSILAFDELNDADAPGETIALMEQVGLNNIKLERFRYASRVSFFRF
ncbi:MAG: crotonobetainyl-CoA--carnitine CoA-transferase [Candidatus Marinimicrobia bacterium]|nr:crotonobetainyl-CoA--carnitine CoA-transferase [Candidatus Neomarinimicrobiota bacterium]|tara:strand:- start:2626 stop:3378 length:753 start_codon:yes stop_codon:yes gene_type:complete